MGLGFVNTKDLYRIVRVEDLEGNIKKDYLEDKHLQSHYKIDWAGDGDSVYLWNHNNEIDHTGMRTSYADSITEEDSKVIITTRNSVYHLVSVD